MKQAGQAVIGIMGIVCMDVVRVAGQVVIGGILMFLQKPVYAVILTVWTVLYLSIVFALARRCVVQSKSLVGRDFHFDGTPDRRDRQCRSRSCLCQSAL